MDFTRGVNIPWGTQRRKAKIAAKPTKFFCGVCEKELGAMIIRCAECHLFLCLDCLSNGVEAGAHKKTHAYRVSKAGRTSLFDAAWDLEEELLLVEGLQVFGAANWRKVAEHVGVKTEQQCYEHYRDTWMNQKDLPMPLVGDKGPLRKHRSTLGEFVPVGDTIKEPRKKVRRVAPSHPIRVELGGYMPLRNEFDEPYFSEADNVIADMVFFDSDTKQEVDLKMQAMRVYESLIAERKYRTKFAADNDLLRFKVMRKRTKELDPTSQEAFKELKCFMQVLGREKWEELIAGVLKETRLRHRIRHYHKLRRNGVTTEEDAKQYRVLSRKRTNPRGRGYDEDYESTASSAGERTLPGAQYLDEEETELVRSLHIEPLQYAIIKEALVREHCRSGKLRKRDAKKLSKMDSGSTVKVYEYLSHSKFV